MLLFDSSVWIDWLRGADTDAVRFVQERENHEDLAITQMIYLEVLQGVSSDRQFAVTQRVLGAQTVLQPLGGLATFEAATHLYRRARKQGLTIRKSNDCLIAAMAMAMALEQGAVLVHNDRDFLSLAQVEEAPLMYPRRPFDAGKAPT